MPIVLDIRTPADRFGTVKSFSLDGVEITLRFRWSARMGSWLASCDDVDGNRLESSARVSPGTGANSPVPLFRTRVGLPGQLESIGRDPYLRTDLGTDRLLILYRTAAELSDADS